MDTSAEADTETEVVAKRMRPAKSSYATGGKSAAASVAVSPSAAATNGSAAADKTDDTAEEVGNTVLIWVGFGYVSFLAGTESFFFFNVSFRIPPNYGHSTLSDVVLYSQSLDLLMYDFYSSAWFWRKPTQ